MSEYQERHAVSRLIGAPPGYVGYDEGGQLTEAVRRKPYSVVLLDEIEKAHPDVFNILLQVLDDGRLTDNKGRVANFKNTIIIMTSNLGSHIIAEHMDQGGDAHGLHDQMMAMLRKTLRPEFLNRIDEVMVFQPLNQAQTLAIVQLQVKALAKMLLKQGVVLEASPQALHHLAELGFDPQFGARPLKRVIQRELVNPLSKAILAGQIQSDAVIWVDASAEGLVFKNQPDLQQLN
jgi:ATP-dependent Clp protease ATP-binding subunit ClpB